MPGNERRFAGKPIAIASEAIGRSGFIPCGSIRPAMILRLRALNTFLVDEFWANQWESRDEGLEFQGEQWYHIKIDDEGGPNATTTSCSE